MNDTAVRKIVRRLTLPCTGWYVGGRAKLGCNNIVGLVMRRERSGKAVIMFSRQRRADEDEDGGGREESGNGVLGSRARRRFSTRKRRRGWGEDGGL